MGGGDNGCDNGLLGVITFNNIPQTEQQSHVIQMLVFVCTYYTPRLFAHSIPHTSH